MYYSTISPTSSPIKSSFTSNIPTTPCKNYTMQPIPMISPTRSPSSSSQFSFSSSSSIKPRKVEHPLAYLSSASRTRQLRQKQRQLQATARRLERASMNREELLIRDLCLLELQEYEREIQREAMENGLTAEQVEKLLEELEQEQLLMEQQRKQQEQQQESKSSLSNSDTQKEHAKTEEDLVDEVERLENMEMEYYTSLMDQLNLDD